MSTSRETADFIEDQLAPLPVRTARMFGEFAVYLDEKVVAIERVADDKLLYGEGLGDRPRAQRVDDRPGSAEVGKRSYVSAP